MSEKSFATLIAALQTNGLLRHDAPRFEPDANERPWFISLVLGLAGWLAGIFAMIFIAILFEPQTAGGYALTGIVLLAAAYALYAIDRESAFFDQLALALSIAGQLAITGAAWEMSDSETFTAACVAIMQAALLVLMPNRLARAIAAFFACIAWALTIRFAWWGEWTGHRNEIASLPALVGWFVIWLPLIALAHLAIATEARWMSQSLRRIVRPALTGVLVSLALGTWVSEPFDTFSMWTPAGTHTDWRALWPLLATASALFATACAFRLRNRALLGVGIAGALVHVVQFYLVLGTSLLLKSCIMLLVGGALLLAARTLAAKASS